MALTHKNPQDSAVATSWQQQSSEEHAVLLSRRSRHKMRADWDTVNAMLTGEKPRKTADGRDVFQVWADLVLIDPPKEYERAIKLFPPLPVEKTTDQQTNLSIGALYLQAVQLANKEPDQRVVEQVAKSEW